MQRSVKSIILMYNTIDTCNDTFNSYAQILPTTRQNRIPGTDAIY